MTADWHFNKPIPGIKNREPVLAEFFATDAIKNPAEALIREAIQNALDAGLENRTVKVRILFSGDKWALPRRSLQKRPCKVTAKPAIEVRPGRVGFYAFIKSLSIIIS